MQQVLSPTGVIWHLRTDFWPEYDPCALWEAMGLIPYWLDADDPRSAYDQFEEKRVFDTMRGFTLVDGIALKYPGDPLMYPYATCEFHGERVMVYVEGWACIVHADHSIQVARLD